MTITLSFMFCKVVFCSLNGKLEFLHKYYFIDLLGGPLTMENIL